MDEQKSTEPIVILSLPTLAVCIFLTFMGMPIFLAGWVMICGAWCFTKAVDTAHCRWCEYREQQAKQLAEEAEAERVRNLPPPPPPPSPPSIEALEAAAKERYEKALQRLEAAGYDEYELWSRKEQERQKYLREIDKL